MEEWILDTLITNIMTAKGRFSGKNWRSIGAGIYKGYVSVWFSETPDTTTISPGKNKAVDDIKADAPKQFDRALIYFTNYLRTQPKAFAERYLAKGSGLMTLLFPSSFAELVFFPLSFGDFNATCSIYGSK
jgi:hypothetical protein